MVRDSYRSRHADEPLIVSFQGELYAIPGERPWRTDYVDHDIECPTAKDAYATYEEAQRALKQKSPRDQRMKRIYRCEICGYYHFTTNDGEKIWHPKGYDRTLGRRHVRNLRERIMSGEMEIPVKGNPERYLVVRGTTPSSFRDCA